MPLDASTAITIAGVECWDEDVSESFGPKNAQARRTICCRWANRIALATALAGGGSRNGNIETNAPAAAYPDAPWLFVNGLDIDGVGVRSVGPNGMIAYDYARFRVTYGPPEHDLGQPQEVGSLTLEYGGEILAAPRDQPMFYWDAPGKNFNGLDVSVDATPGIPISTAHLTKARRNMAEVPVALIFGLMDHVNDAPFLGGAKGTVLYHGAATYRKLTTLGAENWDVAHRFTYRTKEWNKFLCPFSGEWEWVKYKETNQPLFPYGNLNSLYF